MLFRSAARSVHQGLELAAHGVRRLAPDVRLTLEGNASLGDHHFVSYRERYGPTPADDVVYDGRPIGFSPATLANAAAGLDVHGLGLRLEAQYTGRVYVDNTGTRANSVDPHTVWNAALTLERAIAGTRVTGTLRALNLSDLRYTTTGYMDDDRGGALVPHRMPAATRTLLAELRLAW